MSVVGVSRKVPGLSTSPMIETYSSLTLFAAGNETTFAEVDVTSWAVTELDDNAADIIRTANNNRKTRELMVRPRSPGGRLTPIYDTFGIIGTHRRTHSEIPQSVEEERGFQPSEPKIQMKFGQLNRYKTASGGNRRSIAFWGNASNMAVNGCGKLPESFY